MSKTIFYIKLIHSLLFFLIVICTIYLLYSALFDDITKITWFSFAVVIIEMSALVLNDWQCPLTDLAEQKGAEVGSVADLFLPGWLSDQLFTIFGIVFTVTCLLLIWRLI
jgi:hypothetical protein